MPTQPQQNRFKLLDVFTVSAGHGIHDTYSAFLPPLLPIFIQNLMLSKAEAGLLTVCIQAPSVIQPLIGHLADRYHLYHVLFLTPAIGAVLMSTIGILPSYYLIALFLILAGLNSAVMHAVGPVIAGKLSGKSLGRGLGIWMFCGELGRTLGPVVVVSAIAQLSLEHVPWLMVFGLVASFFVWMKLRNIHIHHHQEGKALPWRTALNRMRPILLPLSAIIIGRSFVMACATVYLPTYLTEEGTTLWMAGFSLTALQGAGVIGALIGGSLSDHLGRRLLLTISFALSPVLLFFFTGLQGWAAFAILLFLGMISISTTPVFMAMVQENFPENRALANGMYMGLSFVLRSIVVLIVGFMGDYLGLKQSFMICSGLMLLSLPIISFLPKDKNHKKISIFESK